MSVTQTGNAWRLFIAGLGLWLSSAGPATGQEADLPSVTGSNTSGQASADTTASAHAQQPLSLAKLEELALAHNPALHKAAALVAVAQGTQLQAGLYPNPTIGYDGSEIGDQGRAGQQGGFISQEFVTGGKLRLSRAVATQDVQQAQWLLEAQRYRVLNAVRSRYYEVLVADRTVQVVSQHLHDVTEKFLKGTEARQKEGEGLPRDVFQAKVEVDLTRISLDNAKIRKDAAWKRLTAVLGTPALQPTPLEDALDGPIPDLNPEQTWLRLLTASPELQVAHANVRRAQCALERSRAEPIPNVNVQLAAQYDYASRDAIAGVQVGIPIPVFNRNQGNIRAAQAELVRASAETQRVELALRDRLAAALERYQSARQRVEKYRDIVSNAEATLSQTEILTLKTGTFSYIENVVVQRTLLDARIGAVEALADLWRSVVEITGLLLTNGLGEAG